MSTLELTYQNFISRISDVNKKDVVVTLAKHLFFSFSIFTGIALVLISLEAIFEFSSAIRRIFFFGFVGAFASTIIMLLLTAYSGLKKITSLHNVNLYAKKVGEKFPEIKDNLANSIQIFEYTKTNSTVFSTSLATGSISQVENKIHGLDFSRVVSFGETKRTLLFFISSALLFTILMLAFQNIFHASANRIINYNYTFIDNSLGIAFEVSPGNIEVSKGDRIDISAKIKFNDPNYSTETVTFHTKEISKDGVELNSTDEKIKASSLNEFKAAIASVNSNTLYWFEYKSVKSPAYTINITNRPIIKTTKITVYPPAYTKLPSRVIDGNEISTIAGSRIYLEVDASDNLSKSVMELNGNPLNMEVNGNRAIGNFTALSNGTFKVIISKNENGKELANLNPKDYQLRVYPDEYPKINILEPQQELMLRNAKEVLIRSRVSDDFGFSKMRLGYRMSKSKYGAPDKDFRFTEIIVKNPDATGLEVPFVWNLSSLNPGTEDEFEYFVEVYDNDAVSGPKMTRSDVQRIIIPSLESLLNKTEKTKEEIEDALKNAMEDAFELKKDLDEIKEQIKKNPEEMGLNDPKKNLEMQNKIENIQNQLSTTQQKLEQMMNDLKNNSQISKETLDKYMEVQKMFQQIDSKELRDALKKLQEAMKNMDKEQLQEAMKNFKFDEENFKKALEKTMELLKKIMNEQKFGELTQKLDEITKKQDELKEQTKKSDENNKDKMNELSKTQEELKKQFEEFQKQLNELKDSMKQLKNDEISKELEKMLKEMMKKQLEKKMEQSQQNLQNSQKNQSQQRQEQISQDLNQMNQNMQDLLQQMIDMENSDALGMMEESLSNLEKMSKEQQRLKDQSKELDKNSSDPEFKKNSQQQQQLQQQLAEEIEKLMSLQKQMGPNPMLNKDLGDAYNEMDNAKKQLDSKDSKSANQSQGDAKDALDKAISKLQQMCQNGKPGNKSGKKPGSGLQQLLQALQQMISQQQQLNNQMGQMGINGNQGQLTQEQMAQMQKLSMQQETIRKNLENLNEDVKKQQELDGKKLLGNLDQIQKDMQEVIKDMQNNNITPETKKRQEKILSRMLDFQLSAREKDFEQKRESRPGKNFERLSPPEIVISHPNIVDGVNQDAVEIQKESYSEDFELMIQKYLQKLSKSTR